MSQLRKLGERISEQKAKLQAKFKPKPRWEFTNFEEYLKAQATPYLPTDEERDEYQARKEALKDEFNRRVAERLSEEESALLWARYRLDEGRIASYREIAKMFGEKDHKKMARWVKAVERKLRA